MYHFTLLKRLRHITHLIKFSLMFHNQRGKPAVGTTVLIINAYKRQAVLIAQDADAAPTTAGVTYLRFMKHVLKK